MRYFIIVCMAAFATKTIAQYEKTSANEKLINGLFLAINGHDSLGVASFFADSATIESPNWQGIQKGRQAVVTIYSRYFKGTPNLAYTITNMVSCGNSVVVEYTFAGTFSNPENSSPAYMKNKTYSLKGCTRFNLSGNKITASVSYFDQVAFLRQVGFFDQH